MAEDQHVVGRHVDQHRRHRRTHDDPGPPDAAEEAAEAVPRQPQDAADDQDVEIDRLRGQLAGGRVRDREQPVSQGDAAQYQGVGQDCDEQRLGHRHRAALLLSRSQVLGHEGGGVAGQPDEEGHEHEAGHASAHGRAHVLRSQAGQEQAVHEHHHRFAGTGDDHRQGDGQQLANTSLAVGRNHRL